MRYIKCLSILILLLNIAACSSAQSDQQRFLNSAASIPPIQTPPGIKNPTAASYYPVPAVSSSLPLGTQPSLIPPGSQIAAPKTQPTKS